MTEDNKKSYREILKATTLFGGVQVVNIFITLLRAKIVAIFLGPAGMGISNLLISSTSMISIASGLGLNYSALRDIAISSKANDKAKTSATIQVIKKWFLFTGVAGVAITICLSRLLSYTTFGNREYTWSYIFLSASLLFAALSNGNNMIMQGMGLRKYMAKSSVLGSLAALFSAAPLYYFYRTKGIIPALIISAFATYLISLYFENKIKYENVKISNKEVVCKGFEMAKLGIAMVLATFAGLLCTYAINAIIRYKGGIADVGLYQAGQNLTTQYVGIVFTAMAMDFYPKLSAISNDNIQVRKMVNQQTEMVLLIIAPFLIALMVFAPLAIKLLLSDDFLKIIDFVRVMALVCLIRAFIYPIGYVSIAKGDKKVFLFFGLIGNVYSAILQLIGYFCFGLMGIAAGLLISDGISLLLMHLITNKRYFYKIESTLIACVLKLFALCTMALICFLLLNKLQGYIVGNIILMIASVHSFKELKKRL